MPREWIGHEGIVIISEKIAGPNVAWMSRECRATIAWMLCECRVNVVWMSCECRVKLAQTETVSFPPFRDIGPPTHLLGVGRGNLTNRAPSSVLMPIFLHSLLLKSAEYIQNNSVVHFWEIFWPNWACKRTAQKKWEIWKNLLWPGTKVSKVGLPILPHMGSFWTW